MATKKTRSKRPTTQKRATPSTRGTASRVKEGSRSARSTHSPRRSISAATARSSREEAIEAQTGGADSSLRHEVEIDEARERAGEPLEAFHLETSEGTDSLAEELGEEFVENVTGADDAATQHRAEPTEEENGGPFVFTTGDDEYASGIDDTNPLDGTREPLPRASARET